MINQSRFDLIKEKNGDYASWAIWADSGRRPKDNIGDLSIFRIEENDGFLNQLNPNMVLVGLNISRPIQSPLGNFHDGRPGSMDYKIRYALKGTVLWGAYMTDIIKDFEQRASGEMMAYLRKNKDFERGNLKLFKEELSDLGVNQPTLIAFGRDAFTVLTTNLGESYEIWKLPHYSSYMSKEAYRKKVTAIIELNAHQSNNAVELPPAALRQDSQGISYRHV